MNNLRDNIILENKPTVREAVYAFFRRVGVDTIFGNPGSTELPMFRNFPSDFHYILGLQESIVVAMADGFAQGTGKASVINLHSAAGVGNAMGTIFTAFKNHTPLVIIAGQQARSILPYDPFLASVRATELPQPYVKWSVEPARGEDVALAVQRAWHIAMQEPKGPVLISVPVDDWEREAEEPELHTMSTQVRAPADIVTKLSAALDSAKRPAFIAGGGVDRAGGADLLVALAEKHEARVFAAPMSGRCSFPEKHRLFAGFLPAMREKIVEKLESHDLIVVCGAPAFPYHVEGHGPHVPEGATLYQITEDAFVASWTPVGCGVIGNVRLVLEDVLAQSKPPHREAPEIMERPQPVAASQPMTTPFVLQALAALPQNQLMIVEEAPGARSMIQQYLPIEQAGHFLTMESGGLGYGMPAAVGQALARPDMKVLGLVGDGSAMYSIQALWSAAQLKLPITWVILRNGAYNALNDFAPVFGFSSQEYVEGTDLPDMDFVRLAQSLGCDAWRVENPQELEVTLKEAFASKKTTLIEVVVRDGK